MSQNIAILGLTISAFAAGFCLGWSFCKAGLLP